MFSRVMIDLYSKKQDQEIGIKGDSSRPDESGSSNKTSSNIMVEEINGEQD